MAFQTLTVYLNNNELFQTATKKVIKYKQVSSHDDTSKNTFYIHTGEPIEIVTILDGEVETKNTCKNGDYVLTGLKGEKYVVVAKKIPNLYNLLEGLLITRQLPRKVVKITKLLLSKLKLQQPIEFTATWGEGMKLYVGDYLVKEDEGKYYKIDGDVFKKTYKL